MKTISKTAAIALLVIAGNATADNRHDLYRIEQELGTTIQAIPAEIDKSLYVAPG